MLLAVDIGNTATKFGLFEGETLTAKFSIPTKRDATADEIKLAVGDLPNAHFESAIVCSVVPDIEPAMTEFLRSAANVEPVFVNNSFDFGLKIKYVPLESLGTDRVVAAFAAVEKYGAPVVVCSLGTATTIDVVNAIGDLLGGVIAPGMDAMAEALHLKTAKLPNVEVTKPNDVIGSSTIESIRSGVYCGYVSMVEGLIKKVRAEAGVDASIVATGGNSALLPTEIGKTIVAFDENLILDGLRSLHARLS